jgi:hypothetical protein
MWRIFNRWIWGPLGHLLRAKAVGDFLGISKTAWWKALVAAMSSIVSTAIAWAIGAPPWALYALFLIAFLIVLLIIQLMLYIRHNPREDAARGKTIMGHAPRLEYRGVQPVSTRAFQIPLNRCALWKIAIRNSQVLVANTAYNVRASIEYGHADNVNNFRLTGIWEYVDSSGGSFLYPTVSLDGNETQELIVAMQSATDERVVTAPDDSHIFKVLSIGHWNIKITISSDNAGMLVLQGGFTLYPDGNRIVFDQPEFTITQP